MVTYVPILTEMHNSFTALNHDDVQEDLLAHAQLSLKRDQNCQAENTPSYHKNPTEVTQELQDATEDGNTASESEDTTNSATEDNSLNVEDFTNDPLLEEKENEKTPTLRIEKKKKSGRPKKSDSKITELPRKEYNTRNKTTNQTTNPDDSTSHANKFVIEDEAIATSGMNTTFKNWADLCDEDIDAETTTSP